MTLAVVLGFSRTFTQSLAPATTARTPGRSGPGGCGPDGAGDAAGVGEADAGCDAPGAVDVEAAGGRAGVGDALVVEGIITEASVPTVETIRPTQPFPGQAY